MAMACLHARPLVERKGRMASTIRYGAPLARPRFRQMGIQRPRRSPPDMADAQIMTDLLPPSIDDLIRCVERELMRRRRLYPARIKTHRLKPAEAEREMMLMREVLATLQRLAAQRRMPQGTAYEAIRSPPVAGKLQQGITPPHTR